MAARHTSTHSWNTSNTARTFRSDKLEPPEKTDESTHTRTAAVRLSTTHAPTLVIDNHNGQHVVFAQHHA